MSLSRAQWVTLVLLVVGIVHAAVTAAVDSNDGYQLGWPLLIGAAFVAGFVSPRHWPAWGAVALVPLAVVTLFGDSIIGSNDRGTGSVTLFFVVIQALVATVASLMGSQLAQLGATRGVRQGRGRGLVVASALLVIGLVWAGALAARSDSNTGRWLDSESAIESGLFDGPFFVFLWVVFPVVAALAAAVSPKLWGWWGVLLVTPAMVALVIVGLGGNDDIWKLGIGVLLLAGVWATAFAALGAVLARRRRSTPQLSPTPQ
ncbi:MAG: hypothetical protein ACR2QE_17465 [Acidimicrobiales bacterium]